MSYNFINNADLRKLLQLVFDTTSGHDHDGSNSKAVTTGTPADSAVTTAKIAAGALSADAAGRAKLADNIFDAATVAAKFATDSFSQAVLLQLIADGAFAANANILALFADGLFTAAKLAATAKTHTAVFAIEDLGAGVDIADRVLMFAPSGLDITLTNVSIIPLGSAAGVDDANTAVITLTDGSNTIVEKTYNTGTQPPAENAIGDLGALDATYKVLSAGEKLHLAVTNGATANLPAFMLQVSYTVAEAA